MPGDLTITSQRASAASPPPPVASTGCPATRAAGGRSSTSTGVTPSVASLPRLARPSTPRPHTPTDRPRSSDQEIVGRISIRDEVRAERAEQRVGRGELAGQAVEFTGQRLEQPGLGPVRALGGQRRGGPA